MTTEEGKNYLTGAEASKAPKTSEQFAAAYKASSYFKAQESFDTSKLPRQV